MSLRLGARRVLLTSFRVTALPALPAPFMIAGYPAEPFLTPMAAGAVVGTPYMNSGYPAETFSAPMIAS